MTWFGGGIIAGILAGLLGIGGGVILVPLLVSGGMSPIQAIATSSLSIVITAMSGTWQNWRMGFIRFDAIFVLAIGAIITSQLGVYLASLLSGKWLLFLFSGLLLLNIYLLDLRQRISRNLDINSGLNLNRSLMELVIGGSAGILAGLFGVGGGVIMVPLQVLCLGIPIKMAIQTSLGVIVITGLSATIGHGLAHNVNWLTGIILGIGGLLGAQIGARYLPKLSDRTISFCFRLTLFLLSIYMFIRGYYF